MRFAIASPRFSLPLFAALMLAAPAAFADESNGTASLASDRVAASTTTADNAIVPPAPAPTVTAEQAAAAFERFKALEGTWLGQSTRGWSDSGTWRTIAGGSVAMHASFDAHPGETMVTMVHPDGGRLLLTHYCVARNQPRLVLSKVEEDGARLTFTWLDGTNLPSRDAGHMDQVVMRFLPDGNYTSQWTWYQKGSESWMEEIENRRAPEPDEAAENEAPADAPSEEEAPTGAGK